MAGAGKKWMVGCGIGCGLMLLILGGVGTCGYFGVKKLKEQSDELGASATALNDRFGVTTDFVPSPDGTISSYRMETFLTVRDDMAPARDEAANLLDTLDGDAGWLDKAKAGIRMVPTMLGFIRSSRGVLLDNDMAPGEYLYIYSLSYYVLLHKDPGDGPSFVLSGGDEAEDEGNVRVQWGGHDDDSVRDARVEHVRSFINGMQVELLNNQVEAYRRTLPDGTTMADDPWGAALLAEQEAMGIETLRFLWEEGLPAQLQASLEPYRDRLEASYEPMTSILEIGLLDED